MVSRRSLILILRVTHVHINVAGGRPDVHIDALALRFGRWSGRRLVSTGDGYQEETEQPAAEK
ncbi:MAG: hypothetical protein AMXMBFR13_41140 [Phycisphaerae bacterium]